MHSAQNRAARFRSARVRNPSAAARADARWEDLEAGRPQWESRLTTPALRKQVRDLADREPHRWSEMTVGQALEAIAKHMRRQPSEIRQHAAEIKFLIAQFNQSRHSDSRDSDQGSDSESEARRKGVEPVKSA